MTETFADEASAITIPSLFKSDLVIKFGDILETPTIFPDEQGKVKVVVTNQGIGRFRGPLDLNLYASTDPVLDDNPLNTLDPPLRGKDELLGTLNLNNVNLKPGQSKTFTLDFSKPEFRTASVVSPGSYYLITEVDPGNSIRESNENNNQASTHISTDGTDVVLDWNSTLLNAIQAVATRPITAPPFGARNSAIVHAAIYDAVNAIDRSYTPYLVNIDASGTGASPEAAVSRLRELFGVCGRECYKPRLRRNPFPIIR
ncbi:MAG TPA: CARDB domain-containing protein [Leptolyngbyaceae cyanobacterium]